MRFLRLEILNLASLDRQGGEIIEFEAGSLKDSTIFSIVGPTGSGKSTILDAICLALYNRAPRYPIKGNNNDYIEVYGEKDENEKSRIAPTDCRNILTRGKSEGYSKLTFLANNGNVYRAEWYVKFKRKKYDKAITSLFKIIDNNDEHLEEQANWEDLPVIIGLDYDQFLRTVLIAQGSFAKFLTAKENERYELLEKLIGCGGLYINIAEQIKQKRNEAAEKFNSIKLQSEVNSQYLITNAEELDDLKKKVESLEKEEANVKKEIGQISKDLAWYDAESRYLQNIDKYSKAAAIAKDNLNNAKEEINRLNLHDSTLPAIGYYKDIIMAESNLKSFNDDLVSLGEIIACKEDEIKQEGDLQTKQQEELDNVVKTIEIQQPHINKAREIKGQLSEANRGVEEKKKERIASDNSKEKAKKELASNLENITNARKYLETKQQELTRIKQDAEENRKKWDETLQKAKDALINEEKKKNGVDLDKLQGAYSDAKQKQGDIANAIRIQKAIKEKKEQLAENERQKKDLCKRKEDIEIKLSKFNLEKLQGELNTLNESYTLMTSENWESHRHILKDGKPCPLCGALDHPYAKDTKQLLPIVSDLKNLIEVKAAELNKQSKEKNKLDKDLSEIKGRFDSIGENIKAFEDDLIKLQEEWAPIHYDHKDWPEDIALLESHSLVIKQECENKEKDLFEFNNLLKSIETLRKERDRVDGEFRLFLEKSAEQVKTKEKESIAAETALKTEEGKTDNLNKQLEEKTSFLNEALKAEKEAEEKAEELKNKLKEEIGDNDPDTLEKNLLAKKEAEEGKVNSIKGLITKFQNEVSVLKGNQQSKQKSVEEQNHKKNEYSKLLDDWIANYNSSSNGIVLTKEVIKNLFEATDNWEEIRNRHNNLTTSLTEALTTFNNEDNAHKEHQASKPNFTEEDLKNKKIELENWSNAELIDLKNRLIRHNDAQEKIGSIAEEIAAADQLKSEWEQIVKAIGSDGKTLRKIAQCYTLRFLVEHANKEIAKFNKRYELQQVKNSLGLRVIDHDRADDVRETTSLSGGETFIVSLGLALGLSALSSRNISFDNLFIDEGFGTLDPDTLALVIDSLATLQSSQGKKVGVISHTDTMSERITTQIRIIKKGNSGSSRIEIYP